MADAPTDTRISSDAWQLRGLTRSLPGRLRLEADVLSFVDDDGDLLFRAPLSEVRQVVFPWYYFGGGCKCSIDGVRYRLSFVRPNGAEDALDRMAARVGEAGAVYAQVAGKFVDIGTGRAAGKAWRAALSPTSRR